MPSCNRSASRRRFGSFTDHCVAGIEPNLARIEELLSLP